ncbi:hypothetical protein CURTO8I2_250197 [Curtobacterium sp. 8I-2]|nr:hypothetical protein CURTO8I2_250197 [Curtobacterium sp. 8I-2]
MHGGVVGRPHAARPPHVDRDAVHGRPSGHEHPVDPPTTNARTPVVRVRPVRLTHLPGGPPPAVLDPRLRQGSPRCGTGGAVPVGHDHGGQAALPDDPAEQFGGAESGPRRGDVEVGGDRQEPDAGRAVVDHGSDGVPREGRGPRPRAGAVGSAGERPGAALDDVEAGAVEEQADLFTTAACSSPGQDGLPTRPQAGRQVVCLRGEGLLDGEDGGRFGRDEREDGVTAALPGVRVGRPSRHAATHVERHAVHLGRPDRSDERAVVGVVGHASLLRDDTRRILRDLSAWLVGWPDAFSFHPSCPRRDRRLRPAARSRRVHVERTGHEPPDPGEGLRRHRHGGRRCGRRSAVGPGQQGAVRQRSGRGRRPGRRRRRDPRRSEDRGERPRPGAADDQEQGRCRRPRARPARCRLVPGRGRRVARHGHRTAAGAGRR